MSNRTGIVALTLATLLVTLAACSAPAATPVSSSVSAAGQEMPVQQVTASQQAGALLVDVREPSEFAAGHAPNAVLVPLTQLGGRLADIPHDRQVLLICHSGNRSRQALQLLQAQGYRNVVSVAGGMMAWQAAHLSTIR